MKKNKKNKKNKKKINIFAYGGTLIVILSIGCVFTGAMLSKVNLEVEKIKIEIKSQSDKNESMVMKINELSSLENLATLIEDMGLAFNNNNIMTTK